MSVEYDASRDGTEPETGRPMNEHLQRAVEREMLARTLADEAKVAEALAEKVAKALRDELGRQFADAGYIDKTALADGAEWVELDGVITPIELARAAVTVFQEFLRDPAAVIR